MQRARKALAIVGVGGFFALGALSAAYGGGIAFGPGLQLKAGSGSAPANTTFKQPFVGGVNAGDLQTTTTPGTEAPVTKAVPPVKAHH